MDTPKQRALERIEHILDIVEELRHSNPKGTNSFQTYVGKLTYGRVTQGEFDNLLKRVESEGVAKFIHHQDRYGGGWGSDRVEIQNVDWNRFDKYYKELKDEAHVKKLDLNLWNLVNSFWIIFGLAKWLIKIIKKHKLGSAAITILILLAVDYSLAWKNIKAIVRLLGIISGGSNIGSTVAHDS